MGLTRVTQPMLNWGVGFIEAAATTDIGSKPQAEIFVSGTTEISSFGNSMQVGERKLLYIEDDGLRIIKDTPANHTKIFINIGQFANGPQFLQYESRAGDRILVSCTDKTAGVCTYRATVMRYDGRPSGSVAMPRSNRGGALYNNASSATQMDYFAFQLVTGDYQSLLQGGDEFGDAGAGECFRVLSIGNNQVSPGPLTCDIVNEANPSTGQSGRDGGSLTPGQTWNYHFMHNIDFSTMCIIATQNATVPQFGVTSVLRYGCWIGSNYYTTISAQNRLYRIQKASNAMMVVGDDPPIIASGSTSDAWTSVAISATDMPKIAPQAYGPFIWKVSGSGTGRVSIAYDAVSLLDPPFEFTGQGDAWSTTVVMDIPEAALRYRSSDASAKVRWMGGNDGF